MKLAEQVELIRQVFEYVHQFAGKLFVIKIETDVITDPLFPLLARDLCSLHRLGIRIILVPGAQRRIDEILTQYGIRWQTVDGVRVSTPDAIPFIKMAAFDVSNRIMTVLAENRVDAVIGNWVRARAIGVRDGIDFQETGLVDKIKTEIVEHVLEEGMIPIVPNIGWSTGGRPYNISSDELSASLSRRLHAEKLFFISTRPGISAESYRLPEGIDPPREGFLSRLTAAQARAFLNINSSAGPDPLLNMVRLACEVCEAGVRRVHIVDGSIEGVVLKEIFSSEGQGTMIYADEHAGIRSLRRQDIPEVLRIMRPGVQKGILIPRTAQNLEEQLEDFVVYEVDGLIHGCGALYTSWGSEVGEVAAIAVDDSYANLSTGRRIVEYLVDRARRRGLHRVFVLTTQTSDWFNELGFVDSAVEDLPPDRRRSYDRTRRSRVLMRELSSGESG
jgi:amino-acid N-acetyltransferase